MLIFLSAALAKTATPPVYASNNTGAYIVATIGALGGLVAAWLAYRSQKKQKELDNSLGERQLLAEEWKNLREELRSQLEWYKTENSELEKQIIQLKSQLGLVQGELTEARVQISLLRKQLVALGGTS